MHATARAFVEDGWSGTWSLEKAMAPRAPDCIHTLLPTSQGVPKRNNEEWAAYFKNVEGLIWDAKVRCASIPQSDVVLTRSQMEMHDYTADVSQRKTVCWSSLSASTPVGPYSNEYVWFLTFDESGEKITAITEFIDTKRAEEMRSALREAKLLHHR